MAVVGGGSTYTPELVDSLCDHEDRMVVDELVLLDPDHERLEVVGGLAERMLRRRGWNGELVTTDDRQRAIDGADFVIVQLRVGGQTARHSDETLPVGFGCLGQETTGPGGLAKALRTVPLVLEIAEETAERGAPGAWLVDFTNPVGIVTQALADEGHQALGLCNVAIHVQRRIGHYLEVDPDLVTIEHVGLNHLTWVRSAQVGGVDRLPELIERFSPELELESGVPAGLLRLLGALPSYYLHYYYCLDHDLAEQSAPGWRSRAEVVAELEEGAPGPVPRRVARHQTEQALLPGWGLLLRSRRAAHRLTARRYGGRAGGRCAQQRQRRLPSRRRRRRSPLSRRPGRRPPARAAGPSSGHGRVGGPLQGL